MFLVIAGWPLLHKEARRWWSVDVAAADVLVALVKPALFAGINRQWIKLGVLLCKVDNPFALRILFYGVFTPLGAVVRLAEKYSLRLKFEPDADSYWIPRETPGSPPDSMTNQL